MILMLKLILYVIECMIVLFAFVCLCVEFQIKSSVLFVLGSLIGGRKHNFKKKFA